MFFFHGKKPISTDFVIHYQGAFARFIPRPVLVELEQSHVVCTKELKKLGRNARVNKNSKVKLSCVAAVSTNEGITWHEQKLVFEKGNLFLYNVVCKQPF